MEWSPTDILLVHAAATWALVGLIWVVQLVQYPGFALVGAREFVPYHEAHCNRIVRVVAPLMGVELLSGIALAFDPPAAMSAGAAWFGLGLIAANWGLTGFVSVPLHAKLGTGRREGTQARLVWTNGLRTAVWSARGALVLFALRAALTA